MQPDLGCTKLSLILGASRRKVTVLVLCVCVCVRACVCACVRVCVCLLPLSRLLISTLELNYEQLYHGILFSFNSWILIKMLRSEVMASFATPQAPVI